MLTQTLTPAIYRTTISHCRQVLVHHHLGIPHATAGTWIPTTSQLPWWLRPSQQWFHADDHFADPFSCPLHSSLRDRLVVSCRGLTSPTAVSPRRCKHAPRLSSTR